LAKNGKIDYGEVIKAGFFGAVTGATNMAKTEVCAGVDWSAQTFLGLVGLINQGRKLLPWNSDMISQINIDGTAQLINNDANNIHQFFLDKAPNKEAFEGAEFVLDVATIADGVKSIPNIIKNLPKVSIGEVSLAGFGKKIPVVCVDGTLSMAISGDIASLTASSGIAYSKATNSSGGSGGSNFDDFDPENGTNKQKGNYSESKSADNMLNNQSLKDAGYDLESVGRDAPTGPDDKIVKGIDGLYKNKNPESNIEYVVDEAKFGKSQLGTTKDGPQMSDDWLKGRDRILKAVDGDKELAYTIKEALENGKVERVLSKVDSNGNVVTYRLNSKGEIIGIWP
jgi:hypothetical protein